jgi:glutamate racemase
MMQPFCSIPIIKIDTPMARNAVKIVKENGIVGVLATLPTTLPPTAGLVESEIQKTGKKVSVKRFVAEGAFQKLMAGNREEHNAIVIAKAIEVAKEVDVLVLAQGSMALLEKEIAKATGKPVYSSPESGIEQFLEILKD